MERLSATGEEGQSIPVRTVSVNYQERKAGGCDNTDVTVDGNGWTQRTNTHPHHTIRITPLTSAYGLIQPGVTMPAPGV